MGSWRNKILVFLAFECQIFFSSSSEIVELPIGKVRGTKCTTSSGRDLNCWLGIPYARPPVGDLRFEPPLPVKRWRGVLDATKDGAICVQHTNLNPGKPLVIGGDEDCLTLSVYIPNPNNTKCKRKVPVMVYIHGGSGFQGSKDLYGPEYICDKACVGLVTINYRLDCFGFANSGDKVMPANVGLRDQTLALRWVKRYIEFFGGDPTQVTTFGESAGGCCVDFLFFSKYSKGLMQRGIAMAGSAYFPHSLGSPDPVQASSTTKSLANLVGCPTNSSTEMVECLRTIPLYDLIRIQTELYKSLGVPAFAGAIWIPIPDYAFDGRPFFDSDPRTTPNRPKQPMINGGTIYDGSVIAAYITADEDLYYQFRTHPDQYIPLVFGLRSVFSEKVIPKIVDRILSFYFGKQTIDENQLPNIVKLATDYFFISSALKSSLNHDGPVWQFLLEFPLNETFNYLYGYPGKINTRPGHSDILLLLNPLEKLFPVRNDSVTELRVSKTLVKLWTNFAIQGQPSIGECNLQWNTIGTEDDLNYMIIGEHFRQEKNPLHNRASFWRSIYEDFKIAYANNTCEKTYNRKFNTTHTTKCDT